MRQVALQFALILALLACLSQMVGCSSARNPLQSTLPGTVSSTADSGPGSLRQAVTDAVAGDTIRIAAALAGKTIGLTSGPLVINRDLTVLGIGASQVTISGGDSLGVFQIAPPAPAKADTGSIHVTIADITIADGKADVGGGIDVQGCHLSLLNVTLTRNQAKLRGGAIYVYSGAVSGTGVVISDNVVTNGSGGGIYSHTSSLTLSSSTISDNEAEEGGGLFVLNGTAQLSDLVVSNNRARPGEFVFGGGLSLRSTDVLISGSTISGNEADNGDGGAIYNSAESILYITGSTLVDNVAIHGQAAGGGAGGGIDNLGTAVIDRSTITNCSAFAGGGVHNGGQLTISKCTISANNSLSTGGGITSESVWGARRTAEPVDLLLVNSTVVGNSAQTGGAMVIAYGTADLRFATVVENLGGIAGGVYLDLAGTPDLTVVSSIIANNQSMNLSGEPAFSAFNFVDGDPKLGPLQDNGGPTLTMEPLAGSPVIDGADPVAKESTDQRDYARSVDGGSGVIRADIGACEYNSSPIGQSKWR